ncbi:Uncharacterised protein [Serratia entomophila]|nr:Uncharacterised protein [Serratia entomophila]CAI2924588.1 Uncharacterised protein [Serratia entomophila]
MYIMLNYIFAYLNLLIIFIIIANQSSIPFSFSVFTIYHRLRKLPVMIDLNDQ